MIFFFFFEDIDMASIYFPCRYDFMKETWKSNIHLLSPIPCVSKWYSCIDRRMQDFGANIILWVSYIASIQSLSFYRPFFLEEGGLEQLQIVAQSAEVMCQQNAEKIPESKTH